MNLNVVQEFNLSVLLVFSSF